MNVYALLSLMAIVMVLLVGFFVLSQDWRVRLNRLFFWVMLALAVWGTGEFVMRIAGARGQHLGEEHSGEGVTVLLHLAEGTQVTASAPCSPSR